MFKLFGIATGGVALILAAIIAAALMLSPAAAAAVFCPTPAAVSASAQSGAGGQTPATPVSTGQQAPSAPGQPNAAPQPAPAGQSGPSAPPPTQPTATPAPHLAPTPTPVPPAPAATVNVSIVSNAGDGAFSPASVTVKAHTTVRWTNNSQSPHTVSGTGFDSGNLDVGGTYSFTFNTPGSYSYRCKYHPSMVATVVVTA